MDRLKQQGFTLVEMLVAMGVILALIGIAFWGFTRVGDASRAQATQVTLQNLSNLTAEYDRAAALRSRAAPWIWEGQNPVQYQIGNTTYPERHLWTGLATAPGAVVDEQADRAQADAVRNTGLAFTFLTRVPANRNALGQISPDRMHVALEAWSSSATYVKGQRVFVNNASADGLPRFYVSLANGNTAALSDASRWQEAPSTLLDEWNNPIIWVPAGGLRGVYLNNETPGAGGTTEYIVTSTGAITAASAFSGTTWNGPQPGARGFWASAGADGDFSKGDDNVYSFGN
jgi:prepilin-type N-terminal cleavage/methylation domain-containing protein